MSMQNYVVHYTRVLTEYTNEQVFKGFLDIAKDEDTGLIVDLEQVKNEMQAVDNTSEILVYAEALLEVLINSMGLTEEVEDPRVNIDRYEDIWIMSITFIMFG